MPDRRSAILLNRINLAHFAGDLPVKALLSDGRMAMDFNIMTVTAARRKCCRPYLYYVWLAWRRGVCAKRGVAAG